MNTPSNNATTKIELPEAGFPMLTRMISNPLFPPPPPPSGKASADRDEPMVWIVGSLHPLMPDMKIVRMFVDRGGVEVYSISSDGRSGARNMIPLSSVRLIEEAMPLNVFLQELEAAEDDGDDEPEESEESENPATPESPDPVLAPTNGQATQPS
jgi:hypothetical protein